MSENLRQLAKDFTANKERYEAFLQNGDTLTPEMIREMGEIQKEMGDQFSQIAEGFIAAVNEGVFVASTAMPEIQVVSHGIQYTISQDTLTDLLSALQSVRNGRMSYNVFIRHLDHFWRRIRPTNRGGDWD